MQEHKQLDEMTEKQEAYLNALLASRVCPSQVQGEHDFLKALSVKPDKQTATRWISALASAPYVPKAYGAQAAAPAPAPAPAPVSTYVPASVSGGAHVTVKPYGADLPAVTVQPAAPVSKWAQFEALPLGYYTVSGSYYSYGDTGVAVYLVSMQKKKYGAPRKIVRRLWRSYEGKPKWQTLSYVSGLQAIGAQSPVDIATVAKLGLNFGFCCCCLRTLTDPFSVANGIGPVCAKTWGYTPATALTTPEWTI